MSNETNDKTLKNPGRRGVLKATAAVAATAALPMPFIRTSRAAPVEITMLGWYGTAEADMVAEFEAANNVKFKPKYYAGGDNMLAALAQNPPGTFDLIHTDADSVLGRDIDACLGRFKDGMPRKCPVAEGDVGMQGCILEINPDTGLANSHQLIDWRESDLSH